MLLKHKVALVTGGARGIGREIALVFAREGADIALFDINEDALKETQKDIQALGRKTEYAAVNVADLSQVEAAFNKILDKFTKVDILINNAGINRDRFLIKMTPEDWDAVLDVNLKGTFNCCKVACRHMMKAKSGQVVNIASIIGLMGNAGQANYAASKAGIIGLTKSLAKELAARNIRVNAIAPGFIQTDMTAKLPEDIKAQMLEAIPQAKFGQPADVAKAALFLSSELSSYITGQVIVVDGGMVM